MTTMDSDSASQDSDDGRRFRFEATRKDSVVSAGASGNATKSSDRKSKHKSQCGSSKHHEDKKERLKHESNRKMDHSKHESKSSKRESSKLSYENRDGKDTSARSISNDRGSKSCSSDGTRERSRDLKWQADRNRSVHRSQRSRERSYDRSHDDKQRNRCREKYRHHSRDASRERSHQSSRVKSSNSDYYWSGNSHELRRHASIRKTSTKENRSKNSRDHPSLKNTERTRDHNDACSSSSLERHPSMEEDTQECNELDLSQFNILSETDERTSNNRSSKSLESSPCSRNSMLKRHASTNQPESSSTRVREDNDETRKMERREESCEMKARNNARCGSSDSSLGTCATFSINKDVRKTCERDKSGSCKQDKTIAYDTSNEHSNLEENSRYLDASSDDTQLLERDLKQSGLMYGPLLPPGFMSDNSDKCERISLTVDENKIDENEERDLIGSRLSPLLNEEKESNVATNVGTCAAKAIVPFGPALPPHLLQQQGETNTRNEIIGPVLPTAKVKLCKKDSDASSESDNDYAIGPLPVDHPALRNNRVYEQLNLRAQKIKSERSLEMVTHMHYTLIQMNNFIGRKREDMFVLQIDVRNQREEWMTDLPPVQAANLGLGPRKFKLRDGPDISDRSCWTDTPAQKAQKQKDLVNIVVLLSILF